MISRIANLVSSLEGISLLFTVVVGLGVGGYVGGVWVIHLVRSGQYLLAAALGGGLAIAGALALFRVPLAQIIVFGGAMVCGAAMLLGYGSTLLP